MKKKSKDQGLLIEANEEGKATHRSGDKIGHVALPM